MNHADKAKRGTTLKDVCVAPLAVPPVVDVVATAAGAMTVDVAPVVTFRPAGAVTPAFVYAVVTAVMNCAAVFASEVVFKVAAAAAVATDTLASILTYDVVKRRNAVEDKRRALVATDKPTDTAEACTFNVEAMPAAITGLCVAAAVT